MALPYHSDMTVEEYFCLDERDENARYEYVDGQIRMLAGGSPDHSQISANFTGLLFIALEGKHCRIFNSDVYLRLSETRYFHPDVAVSCDERDRRQKKVIQHHTFGPDSEVELTSVGTHFPIASVYRDVDF